MPRSRSPKLLQAILLLALLCGAPSPARAEQAEQPDQQVDHLALAALLIKDNHYDRAQKILQALDPAAPGLDRARYFTLRGVIALRFARYQEAAGHLRQALRAGEQNPVLLLYLAQAHYGLEEFALALAALDKGGPALETQAGSWLLRARCSWQLGRQHQAWQALARGQRRFPAELAFARTTILLLIELGLDQEAARLGRAFLGQPGTAAADFIAIGEALKRAGQPEQAAVLLEQAWLHFPEQPEVLIQLAQAHLTAGRPLIAAQLLQAGAAQHPRLAGDAAELFRRAGQPERALLLNAQQPDPRAKLRLRLGLLLEAGHLEEVAALEPRLRRLQLINDEQVAYALAYALYRTDRLERAETYLKQVHSPELFKEATALREAMARCAADKESCR